MNLAQCRMCLNEDTCEFPVHDCRPRIFQSKGYHIDLEIFESFRCTEEELEQFRKQKEQRRVNRTH